MNDLNKASKVSLFIFVVSGIIWLGSYITRLSMLYQLFQPNTLVLKDSIKINELNSLFQIIGTAIGLSIGSYIIMILAFSLFLFLSKIKFKSNGWLFISAVLIFLTMPFEIYLMSIDYKIIIIMTQESFAPDSVLALVVKRFNILSSFPIIEILSYIAVIYLFIFQPLKNTKAL